MCFDDNNNRYIYGYYKGKAYFNTNLAGNKKFTVQKNYWKTLYSSKEEIKGCSERWLG